MNASEIQKRMEEAYKMAKKLYADRRPEEVAVALITVEFFRKLTEGESYGE